MHGEAGKGDTPRPFSVTQEEWAKRWEQAFGKPENVRYGPAPMDPGPKKSEPTPCRHSDLSLYDPQFLGYWCYSCQRWVDWRGR